MGVQTAKIFELNIDCCDHIFEYLSMKELHSLGLTCKALQKVAGDYFKRNHHAAEKFAEDDGIFSVYSDAEGTINKRTQTSGFNQFITYISHYYGKQIPLHYIHAHSDEFESIDHIYLVCLRLDTELYRGLKSFLPQITTLQIRNCTIENDFYDDLLQYCVNVTRLFIQNSNVSTLHIGNNVENNADEFDDDYFYQYNYRYDNPWLQRNYPKLEYFELIPNNNSHIRRLGDFLDRNPNIRTFSSSWRCIFESFTELTKCKAKLDTLEIKVFPGFYQLADTDSMATIRDKVNQIHKQEFYKRLHLYVAKVDEEQSKRIIEFPNLEKLCIRFFTKGFSLGGLTNLRELAILDGACPKEMELLANELVKLERVFIGNATVDDVLPFIRKSVNLKKVKVLLKADFNDGDINLKAQVIDLVKWNNEREKLVGARKCTIYVRDNNFLATKWITMNGNTDLTMIELKRADSFEWDQHF